MGRNKSLKEIEKEELEIKFIFGNILLIVGSVLVALSIKVLFSWFWGLIILVFNYISPSWTSGFLIRVSAMEDFLLFALAVIIICIGGRLIHRSNNLKK